MVDEPAKKNDWVISFLGRLCLIGWVCAILYEAFDFLKPVRQLCLLFGPWACAITIVNGLFLFVSRRKPLILILVLLAIPPGCLFGIVLKNIAIEKKWIEFGDSNVESKVDSKVDRQPATVAEPAEETVPRKFTR